MGLLRGSEIEKSQAEVFAQATSRGRLGEASGRFVVLVILAVGVLLFLMPLYIMLSMSFKSASELATTSMWSWPTRPTTENFETVLSNPVIVFSLLLQNTFVITTLGTIGVLLSSSVVAYGFSRLEFVGKERLFLVLLSTMMLPGMVTLIPSYVVFAKLGWVNTMLPLTVPAFFGGGAYNIFLLRQFFLTLPRELDEAAVLDGANHWVIFSKIVMPLSGPALATVGVFTFIYNWKDLVGPLLYLNDPAKQTLEVGLQSYRALNSEKWHLLMAGSVLVMIPIIILFFLGQRYFVKGIVMTGLK
ncbi:MAG: carbohydrate ABC transporter permease [Fimbriimonas sp.]